MTTKNLISLLKDRMRKLMPVLIIVLVLALPPLVALAQTGTTTPAKPTLSGSAAVGMPMPLAGISVQQLIGRIIKYILGLTGVIALVMFVYGGFVWMTAAGNQERVAEAKKTVVWATIGLLMIFLSYTLANAIISKLQP